MLFCDFKYPFSVLALPRLHCMEAEHDDDDDDNDDVR